MSWREADTTGDALAAAVGLDMADWWTPTAGSYLAQVPKARIVEAVTEAVSIERAAPLAKLKKGEAVAAAEALLQGTRWLPSPLRARGPATAGPDGSIPAVVRTPADAGRAYQTQLKDDHEDR